MDAENFFMLGLVDVMVRAQVDEGSTVRVVVQGEGPVRTVTVYAAETSVGKLIGKNGRTARAMRTIIANCAKRLKLTFDLDIVKVRDEPTGGAA